MNSLFTLVVCFGNLVAGGQLVLQDSSSIHGGNVAIIGSGAAGSSAAHFLRQQRPDLNITIFEREDRIGGRAQTVDLYGYQIEIGASIFVTANQYMMNFTESLGLNKTGGSDDSTFGLWDGREFRFLKQDGILNKIQFLWRYGWSFFNIKRLTNAFIEKWNRIYDVDALGPWNSIFDLYRSLEMDILLSRTASSFLADNHGSEAFINEFVGAITRVNYAQDSSVIHAWGALVCMVATVDETWSVDGGNWRIFDKLARYSSSHIRLNSPVSSVSRVNDKLLVHTDAFGISEFDSVIIATPPALSNINVEVDGTIVAFPDEYVLLHVTLVAAQVIKHEYFHLTPDEMPEAVYTVNDASEKFISLALVQRVPKKDLNVYKFFSYAELTDTDIEAILENISTTKRHHFRAYPKLPPRNKFPDVQLAPGLVYANSFETSISTMETELIAGRNAAILIDRHLGVTV